jgi:replication factor C large subunit
VQLLDKYTPNTLNGFIGNSGPISQLRAFASDVQAGKRPRPIIVFGPCGTGKTSALRALACSNGFDLLELSSGDYRDSETLRRKLLPAASTRGLFSKVTLILFDEIDELSAKFDKGAESMILQIIKESRQPIAFTAMDYWDQKITFLRNHADKVEFKKVDMGSTFSYLKKIATLEKSRVSDAALKEIADRSNGDVRGAVNDLDMILEGGDNAIEVLGIRNRKLEIFRVLDKIFTTRDFHAAKSAVDTSDTDLGMLMNWVDENIPTRYTSKQAVDAAYAELAYASRFLETAERNRYYGYLKYASVGMSAGVALSSVGNIRFLMPYAFPAKIKYFSVTKEKRSIQSKIAGRLTPFLHTNRKEIIQSYLPMFRQIYELGDGARKELVTAVLESMELEKDEIAHISKG